MVQMCTDLVEVHSLGGCREELLSREVTKSVSEVALAERRRDELLDFVSAADTCHALECPAFIGFTRWVHPRAWPFHPWSVPPQWAFPRVGL